MTATDEKTNAEEAENSDANAAKTETELRCAPSPRRRRMRPAGAVALAGVYAALIIGGKEALAAIPNVEIVTLLCALGGYALGAISVVSVFAFVTVEGAIYGFGTWIVSYYLYWPLVAVAFMALGRMIGVRSSIAIRIVPAVAALLLTAWFSVLTSLIDVGLLTGFFENFHVRFAVYYVRGIPFYITQLATNLVLFPIFFPVLAKTLIKLRMRLFL